MGALALAADFPKASHDDWLRLVESGLKGRPFETLRSRTADGIVIEPVYGAAAGAAALPQAPARTAAEMWCLAQRADMPDIAAANRQMRDDLENGAGGISLVLPGAVTAGAGGVAVAALDDLKRLFEGVDLDLISLRLDAGPHGRAATGLLRDLYKGRNLDVSRCAVAFGLDPIGGFALTGRLAERSVLQARFGEAFEALRGDGYAGTVAAADGRVHHGAGASEAQELGLALATAVEMLRLLEAGGVDPADAAPAIAMVLTADADQFLTIAKLRAARLVWARLLEASGLDAGPLHLHAETAARMMSRYDPHVNLLRTTAAAFAAGCGGADSVTVLPFTHALGVADGFARRMARNIQNLLLEEARIGRTIDPAAGSGYVEDLTGRLAEAAWSVMQQIETAGGMIAALQSGLVQRLIGASNAARARDIARRKTGFTGVSEFPDLAEAPAKVLDMAVPAGWRIAPALKDAAIACEPLAQTTLMAPFEALRDAADGQAARPAVYLATLGTPADFTPRLTWMTNLLAAGGIAAVDGPPDGFGASGCTIACLCSSDAHYAADGAKAASVLQQAGARHVLSAGKPGDLEAALAGAGVGSFVFAGQDVLAVLRDIHARLGIEGGAA